jgi:metal-responsive CopG/Arc/MetJ family transcriptional regulator
MKKENKIIGIAVDKELLKKVDAGNYNRSKLIDDLLTKHYEEKKLKNNS